ncbi:MAG: FHA domain-containing protein, partial [candidate division KSB1 bacterium]
TIMAHLQKSATPPSQLVQLSFELEALIMKCLEKNPEQRFQTMADVAQALALAPESKSASDLIRFATQAMQEAQTAKAIEREATQVGPPMAPPLAVKEEESSYGASGKEMLEPAPQPVAPSMPLPQPLPTPPAPAPQAETQFAASTSTPAFGDAYLQITTAPPATRSKFARGRVASAPIKNFNLSQGKLSLGRGSENDLQLEGNMVSKFHARVYAQDGKFYIDDLNSGNGTYVNGKKIRERHPLREGDEIRVGDYVMEFKKRKD